MAFQLEVGQTKTYNSNPEDSLGFGPAFVQPGAGGSTGTRWTPATSGKVSTAPIGEGGQCQITGLSAGSVVVNIAGFSAVGNERITPMNITVTQPVGELDHFDPTEA